MSQIPALDNSYGAMFLGTCLGLILYGLTVLQIYRYWCMYPKDALWLKSLVFAIGVLETLHSTLCMASVYHYLVTNFFNPSNLEAAYWGTRSLTPITGISILLCQSFFALRVYLIGPQRVYRLLVGAGVLCMIVSSGFSLTGTIEGDRLSFAEFSHFSWLISGFFGCAILTDVCLTGTLVTVLLRRRTGFKATDSLIETLIIYAINTGLLTSLMGIPCFVFAIILPGNLIYLALSIIGVKLYANSVLAVLNSRRSLSDRMTNPEHLEMLSFGPESGVRGTVASHPQRLPNVRRWTAAQASCATGSGTVPVAFAQALRSSDSSVLAAEGALSSDDDKRDALTLSFA